MDCKTAAPLLHPYLDGELDRPSVDALESHLLRCPACAKALASLEALRDVVRRGAPHHRAPDELRRHLLEAPTGIEPASRRAILPKWALAASLLAAFLLGVGAMNRFAALTGPDAAQQVLVRELLSSHLRSLASANPVDVVSTDRHTVKPWFAGKVAQSPPVFDLEAAGFPLKGGRIDYVDGQRVAVLVYAHGQHLIDVYVLPGAADTGGRRGTVVAGYRLEPVALQDQHGWIVADMDAQELAKFREALSAATSS